MLWIDVNTACRHWLEMAYFCRYLHQWSQTASVLLTGLLLSVWTCVGWQLLTQWDQLCQERCQQGLHSGWQLVDPSSRLFWCLPLCQSPRLTLLKPRSALFWKGWDVPFVIAYALDLLPSTKPEATGGNCISTWMSSPFSKGLQDDSQTYHTATMFCMKVTTDRQDQAVWDWHGMLAWSQSIKAANTPNTCVLGLSYALTHIHGDSKSFQSINVYRSHVRSM